MKIFKFGEIEIEKLLKIAMIMAISVSVWELLNIIIFSNLVFRGITDYYVRHGYYFMQSIKIIGVIFKVATIKIILEIVYLSVRAKEQK